MMLYLYKYIDLIWMGYEVVWICVLFTWWMKKTSYCKSGYINELRVKVKKTSKKGCLKFAEVEKGTTFAPAIRRKFTDRLISSTLMNKGVLWEKKIKKDEKRLGSLEKMLTFAPALRATDFENMKRDFLLWIRSRK